MMMMVDGVILGQMSGLKCWRHLLIAGDLDEQVTWQA